MTLTLRTTVRSERRAKRLTVQDGTAPRSAEVAFTGDLIVGNDAQGKGGESVDAPTYAWRSPGVYDGPFKLQ